MIDDLGDIVSTSTVSYFVDTNLFLQCRPLEQLDWSSWDGFDEVRLIVSSPVLREIDYRKNKGNDRVGKRARATSAMFRKMLNEGQKVVRTGNPRVLLCIEPQHIPSPELEQQLNYQERDDQLVGTIYEYSHSHQGTDVRLLTYDTTPLFTAKGLGLKGDIIPDDWLLPPESTETEREVQSLRSEIARLKKTEPSFSIRCVDPSNKNLKDFHATHTWFEPLTDGQVAELIQRLQARFPLETDFGSREPAERTPKQRTVLIGIAKDVFTPATDEGIEAYREQAYPEWLDRCEQVLRNYHRVLQHQAPLQHLSFLASNIGTRPAIDALITIEARGHFQIQPPPPDDEDEERDVEEDELERLKAEALPRPPVVPRGQWKRSITGRPGDVFGAFDALRRSLDGIATVATPTAHMDDWRLPSLHIPSRPHDPNAFYYKPDRPSSPQPSFSLSCDQWRHDDGIEPFDVEIHVPVDQDKAEGAFFFSHSGGQSVKVRIQIDSCPDRHHSCQCIRERPGNGRETHRNSHIPGSVVIGPDPCQRIGVQQTHNAQRNGIGSGELTGRRTATARDDSYRR